MELYVKAVVNDRNLRWPSGQYISDYSEFNLKCDVLERDYDFGFFSSKDTYKLKLTGKKERINSFISYLRMEGFKITIF